MNISWIGRPSKRRRGYSLIENVALIAGVVLLLSLCATLLHQLLRLERGQRDRLQQETGLSRLARAFREDGHSTRKPIAIDPKQADRCSFDLGDGSVVSYEVREERVHRTLTTAGKVKAREQFDKVPGVSIRFAARSENGRSIASLKLSDSDDRRQGALFHDLTIEAAQSPRNSQF